MTTQNKLFLGLTAAVLGALYYRGSMSIGVGAIRSKSTFLPPYKNQAVVELGWKAERNFRHTQNKNGVYIIKKNNKIIYIGAGRNVYKVAFRHFEKWIPTHPSGKHEYWKDYDENAYLMRIIVTNTDKQAFRLEAALIKKYKPKDNILLYEDYELSKTTENILDEYNDIAPF